MSALEMGGVQHRLTALLLANNIAGPYPLSLICTSGGLVVASAGVDLPEEVVAGFTCLFDDVVRRALRDLRFHRVEEVTLLDPGRGRYIVRPLVVDVTPAFFLVVRADPKTSWRRNTNRLCIDLERELRPLAQIQSGAA